MISYKDLHRLTTESFKRFDYILPRAGMPQHGPGGVALSVAPLRPGLLPPPSVAGPVRLCMRSSSRAAAKEPISTADWSHLGERDLVLTASTINS
jgi:hypothetical protein